MLHESTMNTSTTSTLGPSLNINRQQKTKTTHTTINKNNFTPKTNLTEIAERELHVSQGATIHHTNKSLRQNNFRERRSCTNYEHTDQTRQ